MKTTDERFWEKVAVTPSCWLWAAGKDTNGYGAFIIKSKNKMAHRVAYEMEIGHIPDGLELDHLCRVRECVNPSHLEPVSHAENMARGSNATRTHCIHGHKFSKENTYICKRSRGSGFERQCKTCTRARGRLVRKRRSSSSKEVKS